MKLKRLIIVVACLALACGCQGPSKGDSGQTVEHPTSQVKQLQDQIALLQTEKQALENKVQTADQVTTQIQQLRDQVALLQTEKQTLENKLQTADQVTTQIKQLQDQVATLQKEKQTLENKVQTASTPPMEAGQNVTLNTEQEKLSYAIGCQIGNSLKVQETALELPTLYKGLSQTLNGQTPSLNEEQIRQTIMAWQKDVQARMETKRKEQGEKNLTEGKAFLEANAKKEGVKVLASGLQYKVLTDGAGHIPVSTDKVKVHYRGTLTNGTEFDSSYKRNQPAEFPVTGVIKGWVEALQLMKEGSKWELYIPAALAYGESGRPNIPPNSVLVFEVELLEIVKPDPNAAAAPAVRPIPAPGPKPQ